MQQQIKELEKHSATSTALFEPFPLYGILFVVSFASTAGCMLLKDIVTEDAKTVGLLKQAGAIVVGKTNLDQFATGLVGTRSPFGAVPNSFNSESVSGDSSSGFASVVARGLVPFLLGIDTAGSGHVTAAFNNIVGLKSTKGRFSNYGLMQACKSIACISVFALTVDDAEVVAQVLEQFDVRDAYSRHHTKTAPAKLSSALILRFQKICNSLAMRK